MVIDTQQSLSGFIAANPQLSQTERGEARFYARVGHERYRRNDDGSFTRLDTTFHHLLVFGRAAERAYSVLRRGDRFIAEGHVRTHQNGEEFVAQRIGHDSARTPYIVDRNARSRPLPPAPERETGIALTSVRGSAETVGRSPSTPDRGPFRALAAGSAVDGSRDGVSGITLSRTVVMTVAQRRQSSSALAGEARRRVW